MYFLNSLFKGKNNFLSKTLSIFVEILLVVIWTYVVINDHMNKLLDGMSNVFTPLNDNYNDFEISYNYKDTNTIE